MRAGINFFQTPVNVDIFKKNFIEVQLMYNVVLVSGIQQSDSVIPICSFSL